MTTPLSPSDLTAIRKLLAGWPGRFVFSEACEHEDCTDTIVYVPDDADDEHDHEACYGIEGLASERYLAPDVVELLNLPRQLLAAIEQLAKERDEATDVLERRSKTERKLRDDREAFKADIERLTRERDEALAVAEYRRQEGAAIEATHISLEEWCASIERSDPAEVPHMLTECLVEGAGSCECCCTPFKLGDETCMFEDDDRVVVLHRGRCPTRCATPVRRPVPDPARRGGVIYEDAFCPRDAVATAEDGTRLCGICAGRIVGHGGWVTYDQEVGGG